MRTRDIVMKQVFPPIPIRDFDWCCWHDGDEEEGHCGYGPTPEAALADLERLDQERAEALEDAEHIEEQAGGILMTAYASDALAIVALSLVMASIFMLCVVLI